MYPRRGLKEGRRTFRRDVCTRNTYQTSLHWFNFFSFYSTLLAKPIPINERHATQTNNLTRMSLHFIKQALKQTTSNPQLLDDSSHAAFKYCAVCCSDTFQQTLGSFVSVFFSRLRTRHSSKRYHTPNQKHTPREHAVSKQWTPSPRELDLENTNVCTRIYPKKDHRRLWLLP